MTTHIVIDIEATCCDDGSIPADERETIEIGAVSLESGAEFQRYIKPVRHSINGFCTSLTGIQTGHAKYFGYLFPEAVQRFRIWYEFGPVTFVSWGPFDKTQLERDCAFHGIDISWEPWIDLAKLFKKAYGRKVTHRKAMRIAGLTATGRHHRGLDDAKNVARLAELLLLGRSVDEINSQSG